MVQTGLVNTGMAHTDMGHTGLGGTSLDNTGPANTSLAHTRPILYTSHPNHGQCNTMAAHSSLSQVMPMRQPVELSSESKQPLAREDIDDSHEDVANSSSSDTR